VLRAYVADAPDCPRIIEGLRSLTPTLASEAAIAPLSPVFPASGPDLKSLIRTILATLDDAKAEDIISIDVAGKTSIADVMVIATGRSNTHVASVAERLIAACKQEGLPTRVEGLAHADWVLVDANDVIVHIFRADVRKFYNLEKMWGLDRPDDQRPG
jgi:ribosome-associated protein